MRNGPSRSFSRHDPPAEMDVHVLPIFRTETFRIDAAFPQGKGRRGGMDPGHKWQRRVSACREQQIQTSPRLDNTCMRVTNARRLGASISRPAIGRPPNQSEI
ncbi:hypothetical protein VTH06DRAFT_6155 [Thermothelomyces fergusii]